MPTQKNNKCSRFGLQNRLKLEMNNDFMTETLKERQEGLNTISKLMHDIHSINIDLNKEAHKQDEMLGRVLRV